MHTKEGLCTAAVTSESWSSVWKPVQHRLTWGGDGNSVYTRELLRGAHFNDDVLAALQAQVARCARRRHVEGNPVVLRCDGQLVRAHFVGRVAIGNHSVCTDHHSWEANQGHKCECTEIKRRKANVRTHTHTPVMFISLMVSAAMLSVMRVAGIPSATASYAVSLDPWLNGLVSVQYTRFSLPRAWRLRTTPTHTHTQVFSQLRLWKYSDCRPLHANGSNLTQGSPVSGCGQRTRVAVCEDGHRVPRDTRQDVLGAIVTDLLVVVYVTLQHVFNPGNNAAGGSTRGEKRRLMLEVRNSGMYLPSAVVV